MGKEISQKQEMRVAAMSPIDCGMERVSRFDDFRQLLDRLDWSLHYYVIKLRDGRLFHARPHFEMWFKDFDDASDSLSMFMFVNFFRRAAAAERVLTADDYDELSDMHTLAGY